MERNGFNTIVIFNALNSSIFEMLKINLRVFIQIKMKKLLFLALVYFFSNSAFAWSIVNTGLQGNIVAVSAASTTIHFAANSNEIAVTLNAGASWEIRPFVDEDGLPIPFSIADILFTSSQDGYAVGEFDGGVQDVIFKTINGGLTWNVLYQGAVGSNRAFNDISGNSSSIAVAGNQGMLLFSDNSGAAWTQFDLNTSEDLVAIQMISFYTGNWVALSENTVFRYKIDHLQKSETPNSDWKRAVERNDLYFLGDAFYSNYASSPIQLDNQISCVSGSALVSISGSTSRLVIGGQGIFEYVGETDIYPVADIPANTNWFCGSSFGLFAMFGGENGQVASNLYGASSTRANFDATVNFGYSLEINECGQGYPMSSCSIYNAGLTPITSCKVSIEFGNYSDTIEWNGNISSDSQVYVSFETNFNTIIGDSLVIEIVEVNGVHDDFPSNDRYVHHFWNTGLDGVYTVGAEGADFTTPFQALEFVDATSACSDVELIIQDGIYGPYLDYLSCSFPGNLKLRSESGNAANCIIDLGASSLNVSGMGSIVIENIQFNSTGTYVINPSCRDTLEISGCVINGSTNTSSLSYCLQGSNMSVVNISNNIFNNAQYGVWLNYDDLNSNFQSRILENNVFNSQYVSSISTGCQGNLEITNNSINSTYTGSWVYGIKLFDGSGLTNIESNTIQMTKGTGIQISGVSTDSLHMVNIKNNEVICSGSNGIINSGAIELDKVHFGALLFNSVWIKSTSGINGIYIKWNTQNSSSELVAYGNIVQVDNSKAALSLEGASVMNNLIELIFSQFSYNNFYNTSHRPFSINETTCLFDNFLLDNPGWVEITNLHAQFLEDTHLILTAHNFDLWNSVPAIGDVALDIDGQLRDSMTEPGCYSLSNNITEDLLIESLDLPEAICSGITSLQYTIQVLGDNLNNINVTYTIDGNSNNTSVVGPFLEGQNTINFGSLNLSSGMHVIQTTLSTGQLLDINLSNNTRIDTIYVGGLSGIYTVGDATSNFTTITSALSALSNGICGNVEFHFKPGTYNGNFLITNVPGLSESSQLTLTSFDGDSTSVILSATMSTSSLSVLTFNNVSWINVKRITVQANGSNGSGILVKNGCEHLVYEGVRFIGNLGSAMCSFELSTYLYTEADIRSCYFGYTSKGISLIGSTNGLGEFNIANCNFANVGSSAIYGIQYFIGNLFVVGNSFTTQSTTAVSAIYVSYGGNAVIDGNNVTGNFSSAIFLNCTAQLTGRVSSIQNNIISLFGSTVHDAIVIGGSNIRILHNTSRVNPTSTTLPSSVLKRNSAVSEIVCSGNVFAALNSTVPFRGFTDVEFPNSDYNVFELTNTVFFSNASSQNKTFAYVSNLGFENHSHFTTLSFNSAQSLYPIANQVLYDFDHSDQAFEVGIDQMGFPRIGTSDAGALQVLSSIPNDDIVVIALRNDENGCGAYPIQGLILNNTNSSVTQLVFELNINGEVQIQTWVGTILPSDTSLVNLGSIIADEGENPLISLELISINGIATADLPAHHAVNNGIYGKYHGIYTIGVGQDFTTISSAFQALVANGICGDTELAIVSGNYSEQVTVSTRIPGSENYSLTLRSQSNNNSDVIWKRNTGTLLNLTNLENLIIRDITFRGDTISPIYYSKAITLTSVNNIFVRDCRISGGIEAQTFDGLTIQNCDFSNRILDINQAGITTATNFEVSQCVFSNTCKISCDDIRNYRINENLFTTIGLPSSSRIDINNSQGVNEVIGNEFGLEAFCTLNLLGDPNDLMHYVSVYNNAFSGDQIYVACGNADFIHNSCNDGAQLGGRFGRVLNNHFSSTSEYPAIDYTSNYSAVESDYNSILLDQYPFNLIGAYNHSLENFIEVMNSDFHSTEINPIYDLLTNGLVPTNQEFLNNGIAIPEITEDIRGFTRDAEHPTQGCYETATPLVLPVDSTTINLDLISSSVDDLQIGENQIIVQIAFDNTHIETNPNINYTAVVNSLQFEYSVNGGSPVSQTWGGVLNPGDTLTFIFDVPFICPNGRVYAFDFQVSVPENLNQLVEENLTLSDLANIPLAGEYILGGTDYDFESFEDFNGQYWSCGTSDDVIILLANGVYSEPSLYKPAGLIMTIQDTVYIRPLENSNLVTIVGMFMIDSKKITFEDLKFTNVTEQQSASGLTAFKSIRSSGISFNNCTFEIGNFLGNYSALNINDFGRHNLDSCIFLGGNKCLLLDNSFGFMNSGIDSVFVSNSTFTTNNTAISFSEDMFSNTRLYFDRCELNADIGMHFFLDEPSVRPVISNSVFNCITHGILGNMAANSTGLDLLAFNNVIRAEYAIEMVYSNFNATNGQIRRPRFFNNVLEGKVRLEDLPIFEFANNISIVTTPNTTNFTYAGFDFDFDWNVIKLDHNLYYNIDPNRIFGLSLSGNLNTGSIEQIETLFNVNLFSDFGLPEFYGANDFHTDDLIVRNKGIAAVGVTTDIDGELRDYLLPDIGIDEFSGDSYSGDVQLLSVEFNEFICPGVATNIQVSLTNNGSDIVPFYAIRMMSNNLVLFENIFTDPFEVGAINSYSFDYFFSNEIQDISFEIILPSEFVDSNLSNNTSSLFQIHPALSGNIEVGPGLDFENLDEVFSYINQFGRCGDLEILLVEEYNSLSTNLYDIANSTGNLRILGLTEGSNLDITFDTITVELNGVFLLEKLHINSLLDSSAMNLNVEALEILNSDFAHITLNAGISLGQSLLSLTNMENCRVQIESTIFANLKLEDCDFSTLKSLAFIGGNELELTNNTISGVDFSNSTLMIINDVENAHLSRNFVLGESGTIIQILNSDSVLFETNAVIGSSSNLLEVSNVQEMEVYFNSLINELPDGTVLSCELSGISLLNNIFYGSENAVLLESISSVSLNSDFNDWYPSTGQFIVDQEIIVINQWASVSGLDSHSLFIDPYFINVPSNLNFGNSLLVQTGVTIPNITDDIIGDLRRVPPSIGVLEGEMLPFDGQLYVDIEIHLVEDQEFQTGTNSISVWIENNANSVLESYGNLALSAIDTLYLNTTFDGANLEEFVWTGNLLPGDSVLVQWPIDLEIPRGFVYNLVLSALSTNDVNEISVASNFIDNNIYVPMAGFYTVGANSDFNTYEEAIALMEICTLDGDVHLVFNTGYLYIEELPQQNGITSQYFLYLEGTPNNILEVDLTNAGAIDAYNIGFKNCELIGNFLFDEAIGLHFENCSSNVETCDFVSVWYAANFKADSCSFSNTIDLEHMSGYLMLTNTNFSSAGIAVNVVTSEVDTLSLISIKGNIGVNAGIAFRIQKSGVIDSVVFEQNLLRNYNTGLYFTTYNQDELNSTPIYILNNDLLSDSDVLYSIRIEGESLEPRLYHNNLCGGLKLDVAEVPVVINNIIYTPNLNPLVLEILAPQVAGVGSMINNNLVYSSAENSQEIILEDTYYGWTESNYSSATSVHDFNTEGWHHDPFFGMIAEEIPNYFDLDGSATPFPFISTDYTGAIRGQFPDVGAYEFSSTQSNSGVWPGDTDNNSVVDLYDLLNVGYYFDTSGEQRDSTSNLWMEHSSLDWFISDALSNDIKWSDCDGNGEINAQDTIAISSNYAQERSLGNVMNQLEMLESSMQLQSITPFPWNPGSQVTLQLFYSGDAPMSMIGLGLDIDFPSELVVPGSLLVEMNDEILNDNQYILMNSYESELNRLQIGFTKTNHIVYSWTDGYLLQITFEVPQDYSGPSIVELSIPSHSIMTENGIRAQIESNPLQAEITIGLSEIIEENKFLVWPIPFDDYLNVQVSLPSSGLWTVQLLDASGRLIDVIESMNKSSGSNSYKFEQLQGLSQGIYFIQFINQDGISLIKAVQKM
jgi:hypothetical protein